MKKFEYETIKIVAAGRTFLKSQAIEEEFLQKLNEKGAQGWELASIFNPPLFQRNIYIAVLKREIES